MKTKRPRIITKKIEGRTYAKIGQNDPDRRVKQQRFINKNDKALIKLNNLLNT